MIKRKVVLRGVGAFLILFLLYVFLGMLLPFIHQKQVGEAYQSSFSPGIFYGNGISVDRAAIVEDNVSALDERLRMIHMAEERIILSTFDMRKGESTQDMASALFAAADRGVDIKILVDGVSGLIRMEGEPLFYGIASYPNIEIRIYNKPNLLKPWTINGRMHDKYLIVDDKCFLLGGRNTFDYFLGDYETDGRSYDREVLIFNTAAGTARAKESSLFQVEAYFTGVWNSEYVKPFHHDPQLQEREEIRAIVEGIRRRGERIREEKPELFYEDYSYESATVPIKKATLVTNPTHILGKEPTAWHQLSSLMAQAKERVVFHTPYVVMGKDMYEGMAKISENVPDFTMVINSVENGDNFVASSDYLLHKRKVIATGVNLYEFDGGDSTHGKSILVDYNISVVGSYNLDLRSTYVDTELMLVIDSEELNQILEKNMAVFQRDTRKVIDEKRYEAPKHLTVTEAPFVKRVLWRIAGPLLQLVRCLI